MRAPDPDVMTVLKAMNTRSASALLVHYHFREPPDSRLYEENHYRLECRLDRNLRAQACYREHWGASHFERMGGVYLLPPGKEMLARSCDRGWQDSIVCFIPEDTVLSVFGDGFGWSRRRLLACLDIQDRNVQQLFLRLADEIRHPGFASDMFFDLLVSQLAIEVGRYCLATGDDPDRGGLSPWRLRLIDERLAEIGPPPTLPELAGLCQLSERQLARSFRISRGRSIGDYVVGNRVEHARRLLATEQSIKAIALSLGFSSTSSFSYAFRRVTGETPGDYRRRLSLRPH